MMHSQLQSVKWDEDAVNDELEMIWQAFLKHSSIYVERLRKTIKISVRIKPQNSQQQVGVLLHHKVWYVSK